LKKRLKGEVSHNLSDEGKILDTAFVWGTNREKKGAGQATGL